MHFLLTILLFRLTREDNPEDDDQVNCVALTSTVFSGGGSGISWLKLREIEPLQELVANY